MRFSMDSFYVNREHGCQLLQILKFFTKLDVTCLLLKLLAQCNFPLSSNLVTICTNFAITDTVFSVCTKCTDEHYF